MQQQQNNSSMHPQQIQQMQQMHQQLQVHMQHSAMNGPHSGNSMAPGLGNNSGQNMLSSPRPLGNLHQNFPQLLPHQMYPTTMPNQQVQQPQNMVQQAQMGSHQQGHSKAQQQAQAALYWNAMQANRNGSSKMNGGGFNASNSATNSASQQQLNADPNLIQQQRSNQSFPNIPSGLVPPRMGPMNQNSVPSAADSSNMSNSGMRGDNKKMSNEQMLLLRQQQIIAELQSQIQQITNNGGNASRNQNSQMMSQGMNQKNDNNINDFSNQQVNGQLQQMGHNDPLSMFGGMNSSQQKQLNHQQQQQLAMSNGMGNMMNMTNSPASPLLRGLSAGSDFNAESMHNQGNSKQQQFMNPLGQNGNMQGQNNNAMFQNQFNQMNMQNQKRGSATGEMLNLQGLYNQQPQQQQQQQQGNRGNMSFFNKRNSVQQAHQQLQHQQMNMNSSGQGQNQGQFGNEGSNDASSDAMASNMQNEQDLFRQLQMSQGILKNEVNDKPGKKTSDPNDSNKDDSLEKKNKRRSSSSSVSGSGNGGKGNQKSQRGGKSVKRKKDSDGDHKDGEENDFKKINRKGEKNAFVGGWQSNDDIPDRRRMIVCVVKVIEQMRPDASKISHKFPLMAKKLEEHLYRSAASKAEYTNVQTLKKRLQMIAHALGIQKNPNQETETPFNDGIFPSSDDMDNINFDKDGSDRPESDQNIKDGDGSGNPFLTDEMNSNVLLKKTQDTIFQETLLPEVQPSGTLSPPDVLGSDGGMSNMNSNNSSGMPMHMQHSLDVLKRQQVGMMKPENSLSSNHDSSMLHSQDTLSVFDGNSQNKGPGPNQSFPMMQPARQSSCNSLFGSSSQMMPSQGQQQGEQNQSFNPSMFNFNQNQGPSQGMNPQMQPGLGSSDHSIMSSLDNQGKFPDTSMAAPTGQSGSDPASIQRKKQIKLQQQRLLLLRHASKCTLGDKCKTQYCAEMVTLWRHIKKCTDRYCSTPHCLSSRCVLNHYRICKREKKSATCEVCAPVIRRTRSEGVQAEDDEVDQIEQLAKEQEMQRLNSGDTSKGKTSDLDGSQGMTRSGNSSNSLMHNMMLNQQSSLPNLPSNPQLTMQGNMSDQFPNQNNMNFNQMPSGQQMSSGQQEKKLQQQHLLLKQLQQQQAQLLEQQKHIQQQQQLAQPNSPKGEQLSQQLAILFQLQQQISHQQRILQNVVQEQHAALQNQRGRSDGMGLPMVHNVFKSSDAPDASSVCSFKSANTEKTRNVKRKLKDDATGGKERASKGKRLNGTNKQKKDSGKDSKNQGEKSKASKSKDDSESIKSEKKAKNTTNKKSSAAKKETNSKESSASKKDTNKSTPESAVEPEKPQEKQDKSPQKSPEQGEDNTSLISSMPAESVEQHLDSLSEKPLTPRQIAQKCLPIIEKLMNDKYGWVFRDPVNPVELGIPDYFTVVKEPMDLSLVKRKLEDGLYEDLETFSRETKLIFENAILYNGEKSDVGDMARSLIAMFIKDFKPILKSVRGDPGVNRKKVGGCKLCGYDRMQFEATALYCNGSCGMQRIRRNATYFTDQSKTNHWCVTCYAKLKDTDHILLDNGNSITKGALQQFKNDALSEEAWVQCDCCSGWVHQVCALFNGRKNRNAVTYTCPRCHLEKMKTAELFEKKKPIISIKTAKDLPTCDLSDALEAELNRFLEREYDNVAKVLGCNIRTVEKASGLYIRVVSNMKKKHAVRDEMYGKFSKRGCPSEYPVTSKCILLFQTIHGVDVLLFGMYVYEYGQDCPAPNRRRVYISYLDSVHYFQPKRYRTHAYHSILIGYFRHVKARGFHTAHIWSCPPAKGDDYVFYCRPAQQRTPSDEMLCAWYQSMLDKAKGEGVVLSTSTLYDEYFREKTSSKGMEVMDPLRLPYFEGDYIPGEIENIIKELNNLEESAPKDTSEKPVGNKLGTRSNPGQLVNIGQDKVMLKLGQSIKSMKQNFLVVHLRSRSFAAAVERGDDVSNWTEEDERRHLKSRSSPVPSSQTSIDTGLVADTKDKDPIRESESFDTRQLFLTYCQGNHYQFDQLRRAKHTTMMILYHLHNPTAPKIMQQCGSCYREITHGIRYHCQNCSNFDLCQECYKPVITGLWAQRDTRFAHDKSHGFKPIDMESRGESHEERARNINEHLKLLVHASNCTVKPRCKVNSCYQMKQLIQHLKTCSITQKNTCTVCRRVLSLLSMHAKQCTVRGPCNILFCDRIRERNKRLRQQQQLIDDRRREAQNKLHRFARSNAVEDMK